MKIVQGPSGLFSIRLQNDDVQDFDTRWDQAPLAASEIPSDMTRKAIGHCVRKETSCRFSHDRGSGNRCDQRQEGRSSSLAPKAQTQTDGKKPSKGPGLRGESPSGKGGRIACQNFPRGKCTNPSCKNWYPPVCLNYKSESGCKYGEKCRFRHAAVDGQPSQEVEEKWCEGSVASLKESVQLGLCVSRFPSEQIYSTEK